MKPTAKRQASFLIYGLQGKLHTFKKALFPFCGISYTLLHNVNSCMYHGWDGQIGKTITTYDSWGISPTRN